jgi:hypothetical protein
MTRRVSDHGRLYRLRVRYIGHGAKVGALLPGETPYGLPLDGGGGPGNPYDVHRAYQIIPLIAAATPDPDAVVYIPETLGPDSELTRLLWAIDLRPYIVGDNGEQQRVYGSDPIWPSAVVVCFGIRAWFAVRWERVAPRASC